MQQSFLNIVNSIPKPEQNLDDARYKNSAINQDIILPSKELLSCFKHSTQEKSVIIVQVYRLLTSLEQTDIHTFIELYRTQKSLKLSKLEDFPEEELALQVDFQVRELEKGKVVQRKILNFSGPQNLKKAASRDCFRVFKVEENKKLALKFGQSIHMLDLATLEKEKEIQLPEKFQISYI